MRELGSSTQISRASNTSPRGIWSDGAVMNVADARDVPGLQLQHARRELDATPRLAHAERGRDRRARPRDRRLRRRFLRALDADAPLRRRGGAARREPASSTRRMPTRTPRAIRSTLAKTAEIAVTVTSADGSTHEDLPRAPRRQGGSAAVRGELHCAAISRLASACCPMRAAVSATSWPTRGAAAWTALDAPSGGAYVSYIVGAPESGNAETSSACSRTASRRSRRSPCAASRPSRRPRPHPRLRSRSRSAGAARSPSASASSAPRAGASATSTPALEGVGVAALYALVERRVRVRTTAPRRSW